MDREGRIYAWSVHMNAVLVFDLNGTRIGSLTPTPPDHLAGPSALALTDHKLYVLNMAAASICNKGILQVPATVCVLAATRFGRSGDY